MSTLVVNGQFLKVGSEFLAILEGSVKPLKSRYFGLRADRAAAARGRHQETSNKRPHQAGWRAPSCAVSRAPGRAGPDTDRGDICAARPRQWRHLNGRWR